MSNYYAQEPSYPGPSAGPSAAQNLQFFPSNYAPAGGAAAPQQQGYGYGNQGGYGGGGAAAGAQSFAGPAFGAAGVSGRMGEQGGLRTGWLAAFSTEGYDGEPPLLEELGVNFRHIQTKVRLEKLRNTDLIADLVRHSPC